MIRHGDPPYLECSSRGDSRFSAFYAVVCGRTIETQYQAAKIFEDGRTGLTWREAKGRQAVNMDECAELYEGLWRLYLVEHPELVEILKHASGVSDVFGQPGHVCQATTLWKLRAEF